MNIAIGYTDEKGNLIPYTQIPKPLQRLIFASFLWGVAIGGGVVFLLVYL